MSRIGNNPITIPEGVTIEVQPTQVVVKVLGELTQEYSDVEIKIEENTLRFLVLQIKNLLNPSTVYTELLSLIWLKE